MVEGVHHAAVAVSDVPQAVEFYTDVLGFESIGPDHPEHTVETADYFWLRCGSNQWVNVADKPEATPSRDGLFDDPHLAFRVDKSELKAIRDRLDDRDIEYRKDEVSLYFRGPAGNFFEVTRWKGPTKS